MDTPGYVFLDCVFEGKHFSYHAAYNEARRNSVLIKVPRSVEAAGRLRKEHAASTRWTPSCLLRVLDLVPSAQGGNLILENFRGVPLRAVSSEPFSIDAFLPIAMEIALAVEELHSYGCAHNALDLESIWIRPGSLEIRITGLDSASPLGAVPDRPACGGPLPQAASCAYPDLSALGKIFVRLLAGRETGLDRAFAGERVGTLTDIPAPLASVLKKLLSADPEACYQGAYGLRCDLGRLAGQWAEKHRLESFTPGLKDITGRIRTPHRAIGREKLLAKLLEAFGEVKKGSARICLVSGNPGAGKSFLIREAGRAVTALGGRFAEGKADRGQTGPPLKALLQAVSALANEAGEGLELSGAGTPSTPDPAEALISPAPEETKDRFRILIKSLAGRFVSARSPLVLFLDDLQWAGPETFAWIREVAGESGLPHLLLIGACRSGEVPPGHPLARFLDDEERGGTEVFRIACPPLGRQETGGLVAWCLGMPAESCEGLGSLVFEKTSGYPLQVTQFLHHLALSGSLRFRPENAAWEWDAEAIAAERPVRDEVTLAKERMQSLPEATQRALAAAACVAPLAELPLLSHLLGIREEEVAPLLSPAVREGFAEIAGASRQAGSRPACQRAEFLHDAFQEAAHTLVEAGEAARFRREAGLWLRLRLAERPELVFDCVNLLRADDGPPDAGLNALSLEAARRSARLGAFDAASRYLEKLLPEITGETWDSNPAFAREALRLGAECAYMQARYDDARSLADEVGGRATSFGELAWGAVLVSRSHMLQGMDEQAVAVLLSALSRFGLSIPENPVSALVAWEAGKLRRRLDGPGLDGLMGLPATEDEDLRAVLSLILHLVPPRRFTHPLFCQLAVTRAVDLILQKGLCPEAPAVLALYVFCLRFYKDDIPGAYRAGLAAQRLQERFPEAREAALVAFFVNLLSRPWCEHMRGSLPGLLSANRLALERGNLEFAAHSAFCWGYTMFFANAPMEELRSQGREFVEKARMFGQTGIHRCLRIILQAAENFQGLSAEPGLLRGPSFSEDAEEAAVLSSRDPVAAGVLRVFQMICSLYFGPAERAAQRAEEAMQFIFGTRGTVAEAAVSWYYCIALLQTLGGPGKKAGKTVGKVDSIRGDLSRWAESAPMNHLHRFLLVEAEVGRVTGKNGDAAELYAQAAESARRNGFLQDAGLCHELAARFHLVAGHREEAHNHFVQGRTCYLLWGGRAKVSDLDNRLAPAFLLQRG